MCYDEGVKRFSSATLSAFAASLLLLAPIAALAQDSARPTRFGPFPWGSTPSEVREAYGTPYLAEPSILLYSVTVQDTTADLTFWFSSGELVYASYAFPAADTAERLMERYRQLGRELRVIYGLPSSTAGDEIDYVTEAWIRKEGDIEHTVVLQPGRLEHVVVFTAPQSKE